MTHIEIKNRFRHTCTLSNTELLGQPQVGLFSKFREGFRKCTALSLCRRSRRYYRSHAEFLKAQNDHLTTPRYRHVIHPFSVLRRKETVMVQILWLVTMLVENVIGSFLGKEMFDLQLQLKVLLALYVANVGYLADFVMNIFTGYEEEVTRTVVLDPKMILRRYLKTYFVFDIVPIIGYMLYFHLDDLHPLVACVLFQLHKLRLVRMKRVLDYMDHTLDDFQVPEIVKKVAELFFVGFVVLHYLTSVSGLYLTILRILEINNKNVWWALLKESEAKARLHQEASFRHLRFIMRYVAHLNVVGAHFFGLHNSRYKTRDDVEMAFLSIVLITGLCFYIFAVARVLQHVNVMNVSESKYDELTVNTDQYMMRKNFTIELKARIHEYFEYKFGKNYFDETSILSSFSEHLQMEVLLYSCQNLINRVHVFKGLSKSAVGCLLSLMKQDIFVPRDEILRTHHDTESIYFILFGTCGILLPSGKEVLHIEDGDHFGNLTGFEYDSGTNLDYTVVALEVVEVYNLSKESIGYCVKMFPEIQAKLEAMEKVRLRRFNRMFSIREQAEDLTEDIVNELRKGKILVHGIRRDAFN